MIKKLMPEDPLATLEITVSLPNPQVQILTVAARALDLTLDEMVAQVLTYGMRSRRYKELHKTLKPEGVTGRPSE